MAAMTAAQRDAFLAEARIGVLATLGTDGAPLAIPIWYEWDGELARMFTDIASPKVARLRRDGRVCLTVAEPTGVPEAWVALEGIATIEEGTGFALAQRLAPRYYPPAQAEQTLITWERGAEHWATIVLTPRR
ncbi:MAG: pyridoxamine 5'-phosphate oxidase family protein, partial [Thermomicrobiales bacterium]